MTQKGLGKYIPIKSSLIELSVVKDDSYKVFVHKATDKLGLTERKGMKLQLFKLRGARITDEPVTVHSNYRKWTIGNYLCVLRKSADNVTLGEAHVTTDNVDSPDDVRSYGFQSLNYIIILNFLICI